MNNYSAHCFSVGLATEIGLNEAIILQHFHYWHTLNDSDDSMQRDGRTWFFLSAARIRQIFPYLTERKIRTAIEHLIEYGLVVKEEPRGYNRTMWYALTPIGLSYFSPSNDMSNPSYKMSDGCDKTDTSIDSKRDNKIDNNISEGKEIYKEKFDFRKSLIEYGVTEEVADAWLQVRKAKKATNTKIAFDEIIREIRSSGYPADDCIRMAVVNSWRGFKAAWMHNAMETGRKSSPAPAKETSFQRSIKAIDELTGSNLYEQYYGNK